MQIGYLLGIFISQNGREWTRVNDQPVQDDLETAIAKLSLEHAVRSPNAWIRIVDQKTGTVLHDQAPVAPPEELEKFFPPLDDEQRKAKREEWLDRVFKWLLPDAIYQKAFSENAKDQKRVKRFLIKDKIAIMTSDDGSVRVLRGDDVLAEWRA